ncbi:hypothetical protein JCM3770_006177, partial [Rhodotorula araucariae]
MPVPLARAPSSPRGCAPSDSASPPARPQAKARLRTAPLCAPLAAVLVPLTGALLAAWPLLALASLVPLVGLVSLATLLGCTASLFVLVPATLHLVFAQRPSARPPLLPRLRLFAPLANARLTLPAIDVARDLFAASLVSLALDTLTQRVLLLGGREASSIVRENIPYHHPDVGALRLDVYLPQRPATARAREGEGEGEGESEVALAPVVVLLPAASYRLLAFRSFPAPLIALRLARRGACVVVPSLSPGPGPGGGVHCAVQDLREVLRWVAQRAEAYGADAERTTILGVGAGAHVALLALTQSAVVSAREALLAREAARAGAPEGRAMVDSGESGTPGEVEEAEPSLAHAGSPPRTPALGSPDEPKRKQELSYASAASAALTAGTTPLPCWRRAADPPSDSESPYYIPATYPDSAGPSTTSSRDSFYTSTSGSEGDDDEDPLERNRAAADPMSESPDRPRPGPLLRPGDIPLGVLACPLWAAEHPSTPGRGRRDEPETRGEALAAFSLRGVRDKGKSHRRLRVTGVVLVGGTYDVVKQYKWEESCGATEVSSLLRMCHSAEHDILQACPSHLLYAASPLLTPAVTPALLPPRFLVVHGGRDPLVPLSQATLLRNLLVAVGVAQVRLCLCRDEGALGALA